MDNFYSCEPCLFCLSPVKRYSKNDWKQKRKNYENIVTCSRNLLKDKINGQYSESVCLPEGHLPTLCVKCFKCAEKMHKVSQQLMELQNVLEEFIEMSSLEINERISRLAADGYRFGDKIKVGAFKEKTDVSDVGGDICDSIMSEYFENVPASTCPNDSVPASLCTNDSNYVGDEQDVISLIDFDDADALLEGDSNLLTSNALPIDLETADSVPSPIQISSDEESDETEANSLKPVVDKGCEKSYFPRVLLERLPFKSTGPVVTQPKSSSILEELDETEDDPSKQNRASDVDGKCEKTHLPPVLSKSEHEGEKYEKVCVYCKKKLTSQDAFIEHMKTHADRKFVCPFCGMKITHEKGLESHIHFKHVLQTEDPVCDKCGYRTKYRRHLEKHIRNVHEKVKNYKCSICERPFGLESSCRKHELTHKEKKERIDSYKCSVCEKSFRHKSRCQSHELSHRIRTEFIENKICKICDDKQFRRPGLLATHLIYFHTAYTQQTSHCDKCGNKFLNGLDLYKHSNQDADNPYTVNCAHCIGIFESRCDLLIHVANCHPDKKIPYKCKVCGFVLNGLQFLGEHKLECSKSSSNEQLLEVGTEN